MMKTTIFQLERLTCPSCIRQIEELLMNEEGVRFAKVLFHSNQVKINYMDTMTSEEKLAEKLEEDGYPILKNQLV